MEARIRSLIASILLLHMAACDDKKSDAEKTAEAVAVIENKRKQLPFDKLLGIWKSDDGKSFEEWKKNDNSTYQSRAYTIKGADTSWNEHAIIYPDNDNWIFENTVKGQNNGKAVKFTSIILNEGTVQFSNPQHDFPTDVNYTLADANRLNAFIIGPNGKGGKDTIPFNYTRIK